MKIYVASSWRNLWQPQLVAKLRAAGHEVYDFRHPQAGDNGFHWSEIDSNWQDWNAVEFIRALQHPLAEHGYGLDKAALDWCEACVLLLPSGRSAHLEAGYVIGQGKPTAIIVDSEAEPELMYKLADAVLYNFDDLLAWAREKEQALR